VPRPHLLPPGMVNPPQSPPPAAAAGRAAARAGPCGPTDLGRTLRSVGVAARAVRWTASRTASPPRGRACGPDAGGGGSAGGVASWRDRRGSRSPPEPAGSSSRTGSTLGPPSDPGPRLGPRTPRRVDATLARRGRSRRVRRARSAGIAITGAGQYTTDRAAGLSSLVRTSFRPVTSSGAGAEAERTPGPMGHVI
jgi:hypothetical protein